MRADTMWLDTLKAIYHTHCKTCGHVAIRTRPDGSLVCDWCAIEASQKLWVDLFGPDYRQRIERVVAGLPL